MSPKQKVQKKWPKSYATDGLVGWTWTVYRAPNDSRILGTGGSAREAWKDAARLLK